MITLSHKHYLIDLIADAFNGVILEDGISLHETEVIDGYGSPEEATSARQHDSLDNWQALLNRPDLYEVSGFGGSAFLDPKGMRYYLPAYLTLLVQDHKSCPDECDAIIWNLCSAKNSYGAEQLVMLNGQQRRVVRHVLNWVLHNTGDWFAYEHQMIRKALMESWKGPCVTSEIPAKVRRAS